MSTDIVSSDAVTALERRVHAISDSDLIEMTSDIANFLAEARAKSRILEDEIKRRIIASGGTHLIHPDYEVALEQKYSYDKRFDVLDELKSIVPADEFDKAFSIEIPAPIRKANTVKLNALGKKYGKIVTDVLERGLVRYADGPPRLTVKRREIQEALAA